MGSENGSGSPIDLRIKIHQPWCAPVKSETGDWIDLCTMEDEYFKPIDTHTELDKKHYPFGEYRNISLGISMKLPDGYEAIVAPRSSTFKQWHLIMANGIGVIDNSYCGNDDIWHFPAIFQGMRLIIIPKGTRICQFRIQKKQPELNFVFVDDLPYKNRGGFGTTGR